MKTLSPNQSYSFQQPLPSHINISPSFNHNSPTHDWQRYFDPKYRTQFKTNIFRSTDNLVIVILILYNSNPLIINLKSLSNVFFVNTIK